MNKQYLGCNTNAEWNGGVLALTVDGVDDTNVVRLDMEAFKTLSRFVDEIGKQKASRDDKA